MLRAWESSNTEEKLREHVLPSKLKIKKENKTKTQFRFPLLTTISEIKFSCAEITYIINVAFTETFC